MLLDSRRGLSLGVRESEAVISVPTPKPAKGTAFPPRQLCVRGTPTFELNLWCGTCPSLVNRISKHATHDIVAANDSLNIGLAEIDDDVLTAYSRLLPKSQYTALLVSLEPTLVRSGSDSDYFTNELLATWPPDPLEDLSNYVSPYYRTFETPVGDGAHLYELIVPMVPPEWNESERVEVYSASHDKVPTAFAYSLLDVLAPALDEGEDYYEHWVLTHFLLDGHHKVEAAAKSGRTLRLLSLIDDRISIASDAELKSLIKARGGPRQARPSRTKS